jgi:3-oxoacyl-[acyl-carrier-protein] synthase-1
MNTVYHHADALLCSLGDDSETVFREVMKGTSGIQSEQSIQDKTYPVAALSAAQNESLKEAYGSYTRFEQMCLKVVHTALKSATIDITSAATVIILSTTKGNIGLLAYNKKVSISESARKIGQHFNNPNEVIVVSVACISGVAAQIVAQRLLQAGKYQNAVIIGCDELSDFVLAGFHSFQALSAEPCKPFDENRTGLNLGEAAACLILTSEQNAASNRGQLRAGSITNDANHLSGPSKTGAELGTALQQSIKKAGIDSTAIGFVSAHGTATNYNDEMEAKALYFAGIKAPVNSLKPYFGHTLGASGLLETIVSLYALNEQVLIPTLNFETTNVSVPINIIKQIAKGSFHTFAKSAAGFGGCNAAVIWSK